MKIHVVKSRETFLKISTQFALSVIFSLLLSAVSLTCYFSDLLFLQTTMFPAFSFFWPWRNRIIAEEGKERKTTHKYLFLKHI